MNLIQQLQQTPKWREFKEWYKQNYCWEGHQSESFNRFVDSKIEFTKGVFEKFIETTSDYLITIITSEFGVHSITIDNEAGHILFDSFEELLIWYFNDE